MYATSESTTTARKQGNEKHEEQRLVWSEVNLPPSYVVLERKEHIAHAQVSVTLMRMQMATASLKTSMSQMLLDFQNVKEPTKVPSKRLEKVQWKGSDIQS